MNERNYNGLTIGDVIKRVEAAKTTLETTKTIMETIKTTNKGDYELFMRDYNAFMDDYKTFPFALEPYRNRARGEVNSISVASYDDIVLRLQEMETLVDDVAQDAQEVAESAAAAAAAAAASASAPPPPPPPRSSSSRAHLSHKDTWYILLAFVTGGAFAVGLAEYAAHAHASAKALEIAGPVTAVGFAFILTLAFMVANYVEAPQKGAAASQQSKSPPEQHLGE